MSFKLHSHFDFFFLESSSLFFFKSRFGVLVFKLPLLFFFKKTILQTSFFFSDTFFFKSFLSKFFGSYNNLCSIFFFRLKLRGLGYRIKKLNSYCFRFFIGTTNFIYLHVPKDILLKCRRRRFLLASLNFHLLRITFVNILLLKRLIPYKLRGIFFPKQIVLLKPGKKAF